ncbi:MAG: TonB-dependent receptor [Flavobacteriales bacterium]|nr:TonB-dependent receptor [Flavobacteriales bacterium]
MKRILLFLIILILAFNAKAQTIIQGIVKESNGTQLPGANVYFDQTQIGTTTDVDGKFEITTNLTGKASLQVNYIGYKSFVQQVSLIKDSIFIEVILKPSFNQLEAVTITAGAFEASDKMKSVELKTLDIVTTAGALGDISGALQTLPGTTTVGESGRLFVRGGDHTETQTYIDGMLVSTPYTSSAPNLSVRGRFNPFIFSGTIFSVGAYSAEYGQALSSVLQLNTTDLPQENKTDVSLMTVGASAATTQLWKNGAVTATVDYLNLTPYTELISQNVDWIKPLETIGGELSFRQKIKGNGMFKLYGKLGRTNMKLNIIDLDATEAYTPFELQNDNVYLNTNWKGTLSDKWSMKTGASYTKNTDDILFADTDVGENLEAGFLKLVLKNYTSDRVSLKFGGEALIQSIFETIDLESFSQKRNHNETRLAGFSEAEIYLSTRIALRIGGRLEQSDINDQMVIAPRFSTAYKLNEHSQMSFAYGQFYQQAPKDILLKTNEIDEQQSDHYILNYQVNKNKRLLRIEPYYKGYTKLISHTSDFSEIGNEGVAYAYGLDIFYKDLRTIKNAQFWISYSYLNTERKYRDYPVQAIPTFASKHSTSLVYKHWVSSWKSMLSASLRYSTPRVFNNPNQSKFNDSHTKPFRTLDLSWSYLPKKHIIFYTAITNVLGFENQYGSQFSSQADSNGNYAKSDILPSAKRFFFIGCFITFTKKGDANQLDTLN